MSVSATISRTINPRKLSFDRETARRMTLPGIIDMLTTNIGPLFSIKRWNDAVGILLIADCPNSEILIEIPDSYDVLVDNYRGTTEGTETLRVCIGYNCGYGCGCGCICDFGYVNNKLRPKMVSTDETQACCSWHISPPPVRERLTLISAVGTMEPIREDLKLAGVRLLKKSVHYQMGQLTAQ